jgi:hypothetical protein
MSKNKTIDKKSIARTEPKTDYPLLDVAKNEINEIIELFKNVKKGQEFEFIFFSKKGRYLPQEKYIELLSYLASKSTASGSTSKLIDPEDTLDIIYQPSIEVSYRCTITGAPKINSLMKKLNMSKNHVVFRTLVELWKKGESNLDVIKKEKKLSQTVDVDNLDFRVRLSDESTLTKKETDELMNIDENSMSKIRFRYKQRTSMFIYGVNSKNEIVDEIVDEFVRVDLTFTQMTENYKKINISVPNYELEIEYGINKGSQPSMECLKLMLKEAETLLKIIQQSNFLITKLKAKKVIDFYKNLLSIDENKISTSLEGRQPITLEIQHTTEELANKYGVTDKADGERHFMIIYENMVYLITNNLDVKETGIKLSEKHSIYNGSVLDGELIYVPELNRHLFLVFDCLFHKSSDVRPTIKLSERIMFADDIVENCFIFGKQRGYKTSEKKLDLNNFNLDKKIEKHVDELKELMAVFNHDMWIEKQFPLIRRKYFVYATGGKDWEIFAYASMIWNAFTTNSEINCPYMLDGLIFQPLEQSYVTNKKDNKLPDYKWKPPEKNSIDFYLEFEKDSNGKIYSVYDNSRDELEYLRNQPYRICKFFVGQQNRGTETPVLFKEDQELCYAYVFLTDGEIRDIDGNIVSDKTVVEAYYNNDPKILDKFRWVIIRTRHDKTESVKRYGKKYGNYSTTADKVWRSITNPVLMSDFEDLAKGNNPDRNMYTYNKKLASLRDKIGHELIISAAKESSYFQQRTNLAKPMRQFQNWLKDEMIWTFCHPMYQDNRQLSVLDMSCGRGADIMKWGYARISIYVGLDLDRDALTNKVDGCLSRYSKLKQRPNFPKMSFLQADCSAELDVESQKKALNMQHLENEMIYKKFFSKNQNERMLFDRISCQFAIHYMLKNEDTWINFKSTINGYLRNGGYFLATTFDARKVIELLGDEEKFTQYYTDENGQSKILFEIVKKYEIQSNEKKVVEKIGVGHALDVHMAWMSLEGKHLTEYLVDSRFLVDDLAKDCNLDLVSTDNCANQLEIHRQFLEKYSKYESDARTRKFIEGVASFYKDTSVNIGTRLWTGLFRYYVFRKKGNFNSDNKKQKGGIKIADKDDVIDFSDTSKFSIPQMKGYNNEFSCTNSLHHIMRSHKIIPRSINPQRFFNDLGVGSIKDTIADSKLQTLADKLIVENEIESVKNSSKTKITTMIDGVNIFVIERDCNDFYDVELIKKSSGLSKKDKSVILMKEGAWYVPVYYTDSQTQEKIGLFSSTHPVVKKLMEEV